MSYAPSKALAIQSEAVNEGDRVVFVDDIIASGGSALAAVELIERAGGQCARIVCLAAFPNWGIKLIFDHGVLLHAIACGKSVLRLRSAPVSGAADDSVGAHATLILVAYRYGLRTLHAIERVLRSGASRAGLGSSIIIQHVARIDDQDQRPQTALA